MRLARLTPLASVALALLAAPLAAEASRRKVPRIGYLCTSPCGDLAIGLVQSLEALGYVTTDDDSPSPRVPSPK